MDTGVVVTKFEIRVALVGFVSVGKTTVLNALFRDTYGEMDMRRCTAVVNHFRISTIGCAKKKKQDESSISVEESNSKNQNSSSDEKERPTKKAKTAMSRTSESYHDAESTLMEITNDNAVLRDSAQVHEKFFDIELDEEEELWCCKMRDDTRLVIIDIPGINEAGAGTKYKNYIAQKWTSFDCVIVVLDGSQGVNTEEQIRLLAFVKSNMTYKKVPMIILCNKVDEPDDRQQSVLVKETQAKVERIFQVDDRINALTQMLQSKNLKQPYPAFIAVSAVHAFIYRTASLMTIDQFKKFDRDLIEKMGREEVGRFKWKKLSDEEKYEATHAVVSDITNYQERLEATNFDKFLAVLARTIGGQGAQRELISQQLEVAKKSLSPDACISTQLRSIIEKSIAVGKPIENLREDFWKTYQQLEKQAMDRFLQPTDVQHLSKLMDELTTYYKMTKELGWGGEKNHIIENMKVIIQNQLTKLFDEESSNRNKEWCLEGATKGIKLTWDVLSPEDWKTLCRSVLLQSSDKHFLGSFGPEIILLQSLVDKINRTGLCYICGGCLASFSNTSDTTVLMTTTDVTATSGCKCASLIVLKTASRPQTSPFSTRSSYSCSCPSMAYPHCSSCGKEVPVSWKAMKYCQCPNPNFGGHLSTKQNSEHHSIYQFKVPKSLSDPSHWGHLAWTFSSFMESIANEKGAYVEETKTDVSSQDDCVA